jgi:uncharacterized protein affecting Mg2+/Co2+ transport
MTKSEKIIVMLEQLGFENIELIPAKGAWRTNTSLDVYCWEGRGVVREYPKLNPGMQVMFASWETMTKCAKSGIVLDQGDSGNVNDFLISAK